MSQSVPQQVKSLLVTNVIVFISVKMTFIFENWVNMKSFRRSQAWVNNIKHKHLLHWYFTGTSYIRVVLKYIYWSADRLFLNRNRTQFGFKSDLTEIMPYYFSERITSLINRGIFPPGHFIVQQCCYNRFCDPSHIRRRWSQ